MCYYLMNKSKPVATFKAEPLAAYCYVPAEYENIHQFQNENRRTGRAIIFKQSLDSNIVPVIIYNEDKHKYFHALHNAQTEGKYDMLPQFFKETQYKYYRNHFLRSRDVRSY